MKNCLIMGSGRSGTSLASGILSKAGYYMGEDLMPATRANPKGFFESFVIEQINEDMLRKVVKNKPKIIDLFFKQNLAKGHYWLAKVGVNEQIKADASIDERMRRETARTPFCFKDPRFSYTLPAWRPFLPENTVFLCVFRHPTATSKSILKQKTISRGLQYLRYSFHDTMKLWELMYSHILYRHSCSGDWLFLHYDQLLEEEGINKIQCFTGAPVDRSFPEKSLNHAMQDDCEMPSQVRQIYRRLCDLASVSR